MKTLNLSTPEVSLLQYRDAAAQGIEFHQPMRAGNGSLAALQQVRERVPFLTEDRFLKEDIDAVIALVGEDLFVSRIEAVLSPLDTTV